MTFSPNDFPKVIELVNFGKLRRFFWAIKKPETKEMSLNTEYGTGLAMDAAEYNSLPKGTQIHVAFYTGDGAGEIDFNVIPKFIGEWTKG